MFKFNTQILVFETKTPRNILSRGQRPTFRTIKRPKISSAEAKLAGIFSSSISCKKQQIVAMTYAAISEDFYGKLPKVII